MNVFVFCCTILLALISSVACAEDAELGRLFANRGVNGAIVLENMDASRRYIHNEARAGQPFLPASTFKIPNTLIALELGVVKPGVKFRWDGKDKGIPSCNQDQSLATAFRNSCVWCYQELALRIGMDNYLKWLNLMNYGNACPAPVLTTFWLDGDLRISVMQQIDFLKKLHHRSLPFNLATFDNMRRIMLVEQRMEYQLYAKTGWAGFGQQDQKQLGWYVGYVETEKDAWFFALNMDITRPAEGAYRQQIVMEALRAKGIIKASSGSKPE